jgi:hypothetical protein
MTFVALFEGAMVLKDKLTSKYYSCVFLLRYYEDNKLGPLTRAELAIPVELVANPTVFVPIHYHVTQRRLSVAIGNTLTANVFFYITHVSNAEPVTDNTVLPAMGWSNLFILYRSRTIIIPLHK